MGGKVEGKAQGREKLGRPGRGAANSGPLYICTQ